MSAVALALASITEFRDVLKIMGQKDNAAMLDRPINLLTAQVQAESRPLAFTASDVVVSHFEDEVGVWTHVELTAEDEETDEWRPVVTLLLSDVEATRHAIALTDRTPE